MVRMLHKARAFTGAATLAAMSLTLQDSPTVVMPLSSLRSGCTLQKRWAGLVPKMPWGVWLTCINDSMLIVHPLNLVGHVEIRNETQALEFVRFFSSADNFDLFLLGGMVEIVATEVKDEEQRFNELDAGVFRSRFAAPEVRPLPTVTHDKEEGSLCSGKEFEIRRVALWPDQTVRELVEIVCEDGFYNNISQLTLLDDATVLGLIHLSPN